MNKGSYERRYRSGFTLVELLVVIGIVSLLVAILIPAVQSVRDSSRNTACQNNLRQLALAILNYESSYQSFPPGQLSPRHVYEIESSPMVGHLGFVLPFVEEGNFRSQFDEIDWNTESRSPPWFQNQNLLHKANKRLVVLRCPSDFEDSPVRLLRVLPSKGLRTCFVIDPKTDFQGWTNYLGNMGTFKVDRNLNATGIFFGRTPVRLQEVTDGLSNTILLGEVVGGFSRLTLEPVTDLRNSVFQDGISTSRDFYDFVGHTDPSLDTSGAVFESRHRSSLTSNWAMCDGSIKGWKTSIELKILQNLSTRDGGEPL